MKVTLAVSKLIKLEDYAGNSVIEVPDGCTVRDLISLLKLPAYRQKSVIVLVNDEPAWTSAVLRENDSVKLNPMITGG